MGNHSKMPSTWGGKVKANLKHYFDLWLRSDRNWAEVEIAEKKTLRQTASQKGKYSWLCADQIKKQFPDEVGDALKEQLFGHPDFYMEHPQLPGNREAAMFLVLIEADETYTSEEISEREIKLKAQVTGDTAPDMLKELDFPEEPTAPMQIPDIAKKAKTPEELATIEEEKKRLKEVKAEQKRLKKEDPEERAKGWLAKIPFDITHSKQFMGEAESAKSVPNEQRDEYKALFQKHVTVLQKFREDIEDAAASKTYDNATFQQAEACVMKLRSDIQTWKQVKGLYSPPVK